MLGYSLSDRILFSIQSSSEWIYTASREKERENFRQEDGPTEAYQRLRSEAAVAPDR
jgi:hypothetical protein